MKSKNNTAMIAIICTGIVIIFCVVAIMFAKGRSDDSPNISDGPLPDKYVGSWELPADSHVLQAPRNTDMTEDDALADENDFGVMITYGAYFTHRVGTINNPTYKMDPNCGTDAMDEQGMQSDGIMDEFQENASITKIEVYNSEGTELCDTVFVIGDEHLIYYGTGNYVFCAVKLDAVG